MPDADASIRDAYLHWMRASAPAFLAPFALIVVSQARADGTASAAPPGMRSALTALAIGSVLFGRSFLRRIPALPSGMPAERARALVRSTSWSLVGFATAPSVLGLLLVLFTRSPGDALVMLGFTLAGFVLLYPRAAQWHAWLGHLTASATEVPAS